MAETLDQEKKKKKRKNDNKVWQFLCSVKLAVIIIAVLAAACIVGTMVVQQQPPEENIKRYGEVTAKIFSAIQFTDLFHSYWFTFLLVMLCVNLGCCTIKRWRNTVLQIGFLITHVSIILTMIGCVIDIQFGVKGGVNVYEGDSVDYYLRRADYKKVLLDFEVHCDDFIIEKHPPKYKMISYVKDKDRQKTITVKKGNTIKIPGSNYAVTFKEYYPDAAYQQEPINISNEPKNPAVYVQLLGSDDIIAEGWLLARSRSSYNDPDRNLKVEYLWADSDDDFEKLIKTVEEGVSPKLEIIIEEKHVHKSIPIEIGKNISIDGTDYKIEIKEFALDYTNKTKSLNDQLPNNPAVLVEINGPQGIDSRWSFSEYPDYWDKAHQTKYKDVKLACVVPNNFSLASNKLRIVQSKSGKQAFVYIKEKSIGNTIDWKIGEKYKVDETEYQLKIEKYFPSYSVKKEVVRRSDDHEGHNHAPGEHVGTPAVLVEIDGPRGKVSVWILAQNQPRWYPDSNFALLYERSGMAVSDYKSILRVVENGKTVKTKTIEVNDPLKYKGYVFYQSSYDPEGERYTGLQVTKNPGLVIVYSGFILLCVGVVFIFYVKPFLRRKYN